MSDTGRQIPYQGELLRLPQTPLQRHALFRATDDVGPRGLQLRGHPVELVRQLAQLLAAPRLADPMGKLTAPHRLDRGH